MMEKIIAYLDNPKNVKTLWIMLGIGLVLTVIPDFFIPREHIIFPWDRIPGFSAVYGFISSVLIIIVAKVLGHKWLMKKEDYYD